MSLGNLDAWIAAAASGKIQLVDYSKKATFTSVASGYHTFWTLATYPYNPTFSAGNTANGVVPTSNDQGYPKLKNIVNTGYISNVFGTSNQAI